MSIQNLNDLYFGTDSTFEVVSWNIEWFPKNGSTTANYVETILTNLNNDVYILRDWRHYSFKNVSFKYSWVRMSFC